MSIIDHSHSECKPLSRRVAVEVQGHRFQARLQGGPQVGGGRRGRIAGFSRASRKRLLDRLASLEARPIKGSRFVGLSVCLTYAGLESDLPSSERLHRDIDVFLKALARRFPAASGVWRLEFESSGARSYHPHFHLILLGVGYWQHRDVRRLWNRVAGNPEGSVSTSVEGIRSWRGVIYYAAKYVGKVASPDSLGYSTYLTGRIWSFFNSEQLPMAELSSVEVSSVGPWFYDLRRLARRSWKGVSRGRDQGFTLYCEGSAGWLRALYWCLAEST